ncbi:hypothetical protein D3C72_1834640 [compost metagenome]
MGVDPWDQAACQWSAEEFGRHVFADGGSDLAVDIEDGRRRRCQLVRHGGVHHTHALEQFAHMVGAAARCCLVGHGRDPLHQARLEQAAQAHQQDGVGAVAANPVLAARSQLGLNQVVVDRVQHDDGVVFHAQ